ncbi:serine/threonine-protein kinase [Streptomyces sp. SHP 1-2]|uniref:serine/threonine-protein kinase n=1 Tax=Streptomyces sp. SHP 1-2 TaxID=2769489 RepID=UPI0039E05F2C
MVTEGSDGLVIAGRYRLGERLGRGGMGIVWRATDQLLVRQVAVKALPLDDTLSAAEAGRRRERTLREARAVARLSHPHVIVVHDVVEDDERPYMVMELIDGGSLADRVHSRGPVDAPEAARIGIALLGALRTAHAAGILHRDVKPSNVLVADDGRVVLTDFGVAQVAGSTTLTESGSFVGSPEYTAPERMSGAGTGPASDLWSVGVLLCAVLSGTSPFHRDSLGGVLHAVVSEEIRPPAQVAPILPVVRGLLERDPGLRLDAEEAERLLRAFLDTGRTPERDGERRGRYSRRGLLTAVLLLVGAAGAGLFAAALLADGDGGGGAPVRSASATPPPAGPSASSVPSVSSASSVPSASPGTAGTAAAGSAGASAPGSVPGSVPVDPAAGDLTAWPSASGASATGSSATGPNGG